MSFPADGRLELEWHPVEADLLEVRSASRSARQLRAVLAAAAVGLSACAGGLLVERPVLAVVGLLVAGVPLLLRTLGAVLTRRAFRRTPTMQMPIRAIVDVRDGVTLQSGNRSSQWHWGAIAGMVETPRTFLLPLSGAGGRQYVLLAKRGLGGTQQVGLLRALLADRVAA